MRTLNEFYENFNWIAGRGISHIPSDGYRVVSVFQRDLHIQEENLIEWNHGELGGCEAAAELQSS